jgi:hypothetical protein
MLRFPVSQVEPRSSRWSGTKNPVIGRRLGQNLQLGGSPASLVPSPPRTGIHRACHPSLCRIERMEGTKQCPFCAETIQVEALVCRSCHFDLRTGKPFEAASPAEPRSQKSQPTPARRPRTRSNRAVWYAGMIGVLFLIAIISDDDNASSQSSTQRVSALL